MQQYYLHSPLRGYARGMKHQDITSHPQYQIIQRRMKIISFYDQFGLDATREAFAVSRATIYNWKRLPSRRLASHPDS